MSTISTNLSLVLAAAGDLVDVSSHVAGNFSILDTKWSTSTPQPVQVGGTGTPGSSTEVARSNHVHVVQTDTPASTGTSNGAGTSTKVASADHVHKVGDLSVVTASLEAGAVTAAKLASDAVTTVKILDANVTTAKLADGAVTHDKLAARQQFNVGMAMFWEGSEATIPSGWARQTNANGMAICAVGGATFLAVGTTAGAATVSIAHDHGLGSHTHGVNHTHTLGSHTHGVNHTHTVDSHTHSVPGLSVSITSGGESADNGLGNNGGVSAPSVGHTHAVSGTTGAGTSGGSTPGTGSASATTSTGPTGSSDGPSSLTSAAAAGSTDTASVASVSTYQPSYGAYYIVMTASS